MAYSPEQWERTKAYFESGQYSLSQISDKTGISKSKISEREAIKQATQARKASKLFQRIANILRPTKKKEKKKSKPFNGKSLFDGME